MNIRNILMLAIANLKKNKSQTMSMLILMLITSMLFNMGLVMYFGVGRFFDERAEELNSAHFITLKSKNSPSDAQLDFIKQFPGVAEIETQNILVGMGTRFEKNLSSAGAFIIANGSDAQQMNPPSLIGDFLPLKDNEIYIPHFMFLEGGYMIGDNLKLNFTGVELDFTIAGSTEEVMFGHSALPNWRVYVSDDTFKQLNEEFSSCQAVMLSARMKDIDDTVLLVSEYMQRFMGTEYDNLPLLTGLFPVSYDSIAVGRTQVPVIIAVFMMAFSIILLAVGVVVIRFRINNYIEENMINIGTLKAIGYLNYQIVLSIIIQFSIITFIGSLIGIVLSNMTLPFIAEVFEPMLALPWNPNLDIIISFVVIFLIMFIVMLFTFLAASRIFNLHPLIALYGGANKNKLKTNPIPLEKNHGSLVFLLAMKQLLLNKKQSFMVSVIICGLTFALVGGLAVYYNLNINQDAFLCLLSGEYYGFDAFITLDDDYQESEFHDMIQNHPDVDKVIGASNIGLFIDNVMINTTVIEDFSLLSGNSLVEGSFPCDDNEIVLGSPALILMEKGIGDWVTIKKDGTEQEYLITGIIQTTSFSGLVAMINHDAFAKIQPYFTFNEYLIRLIYENNVSQFIDFINETYGDIINNLFPMREQLESQIGAMGDLFAMVTAAILLVVIVVVILILYLIIKTTILRQKRELGIQKAIGFTNFQLMNKIALYMTIPIILGAITGAIFGQLGFNLIVVTVLRSFGIVHANLPTPIVWTVVMCIIFMITAYIISLLITWRIRKISAYVLVSR